MSALRRAPVLLSTLGKSDQFPESVSRIVAVDSKPRFISSNTQSLLRIRACNGSGYANHQYRSRVSATILGVGFLIPLTTDEGQYNEHSNGQGVADRAPANPDGS